MFWSIKNSCEVLTKLKSRDFQASTLSTYDFSTHYTTLPHNLIKEKLIDLIEHVFKREERLYIACNATNAFFTNEDYKRYTLWPCQKVIEKKVQVGKDQEKAQSEKDSHSKNRGGKKPN